MSLTPDVIVKPLPAGTNMSVREWPHSDLREARLAALQEVEDAEETVRAATYEVEEAMTVFRAAREKLDAARKRQTEGEAALRGKRLLLAYKVGPGVEGRDGP